ncbi:MAG: hypothetical protein MUF25_09655 [Pirellulaceae bacterium]|nr:hypothetical protein [Pirellulaceae bacterium]
MRCYLPFIATPKAGPKAQRQVVMSGCYLFFRFCPNLNSTFPAEELDEVRDEDLPTALDALAREWLKQHPDAVATVEDVTKWFRLVDDPADSHDIDLDELRWEIDEFRRELGIHPDQPLFLRVAPLAGWGWPLPQPLFRGQVVSERIFFARAPDHSTAASALEYIRRLAAKSLKGDWLKPRFGCCAESGFTKEERERIEITYDLLGDTPSFVQIARRVLATVAEVRARDPQAGPAAKPSDAGPELAGKSKGRNINGRMLDVLQRGNEKARGWTARQWATHLHCSASTINDTPTWKDLSAARKLAKAERALSKHRRSKSRRRTEQD